MSPVEPSEAMQTLEQGRINAGFVFFCLAIISTILFGRVFCGWGCHVVALQDLCGAIMKRFGVRPRPFRSRLLLWFPAGIAFYMFAWPSLRRTVVCVWPDASRVLGTVAPFPGFSLHLTETHFWQTFPAVVIAVPFLLVCGFAVVYFLGAKGFCTYGCPYGAIFAPADRLAFGRINADLDACRSCGHCTATCTSNVRVHEEIQLYRRVVDIGCMKCMDCVSVCPTNALSYGLGRPSIGVRPFREDTRKRRYDLTPGEEIVLSVVVLGAFLGVRGAYGQIPMLMAVGVALVTVFGVWKWIVLARRRDVSLHRFALKRAGRIRRAGWVTLAGFGALLLLVAHTSWINTLRILAERADRSVQVSRQDALTGRLRLDEETSAAVERAIRHYSRARGLSEGGFGLLSTPGISVRVGWLQLVAGRPDAARRTLAPIAENPDAEEGFLVDYGRIVAAAGTPAEAIRFYEERLVERPTLMRLRATLASLYMEAGRIPDAVRELRRAASYDPTNGEFANDLAVALFLSGDVTGAVDEMTRAAELLPDDPDIRRRLAEMKRLVQDR